MEFNFRRSNSQMEHDPVYHNPYFNYTSFSDRSIREGLCSGTSVGGGYGGVEILRGSVDMREAIQRQVEKDRIRDEILAEDAARRRVLEAEVRRELMLETLNGGGFQSSFMVGPPLSENTRLEPARQTVAPVSFEERYGGSGRHRREIGDFEAVSIHRPFWLPRGGELEVVDLDGSANRKPPAAAPGGSEIGLGVAPKKSVKKQSSLIKNSSKYVPIDSKKEDMKSEFSFRCTMCDVEASSEIVMNQHKEGKKHMKNLEKLKQESGGHGNLGIRKRSKPKKTRRKQKSHKVARHR